VLEMVVAGKVPRDIEAIFRKGSDWDVGMDHILVLQVGSENCGQINTHISAESGVCSRFWLPESSFLKNCASKRAQYLVIHMSAQIMQQSCKCHCLNNACACCRHRRMLLTKKCRTSSRS